MALGNGVLQDKIVTPKWFILANANGFEDGGTNRETIVKEVNSAAIKRPKLWQVSATAMDGEFT